MKQLLQQYAEYNLWANTRIAEVLNSLSNGQQHKEITSSFNSLYKTVFHVRGATFLWLNRMLKKPNITQVEDSFKGSMKLLCGAWNEIDKQWLDFLNNVSEENLAEKLSYQNIKGDSFSEPIYLIIHHLFNHATYHRGQLITMLRQAGVEKLPSTDFIFWVRTRN